MLTSRTEIATALCEISRRAGAEILVVYGRADHGVRSKEDGSPVTEADSAASSIILAGLGSALPGVDVVCEESDKPDRAGERFILVDPLDGTKEFITRNGEFTVNIALVEGGRPVVGVVFAPAMDRLFVGWMDDDRGHAYEEREGEKRLITARAPRDALVAVVSRSHADARTDAYLERLKIGARIGVGSSLKLCMIARGEADVYPRLGRTMEWDTAAGHAVVAAAGGSVTCLDGTPLRYGKPGWENPDFVVRGRGS